MSNAVKIAVDEQFAVGDAFTQAACAFRAKAGGKSALVMGGTGEVGREVVKHLLVSGAFDRVTVVGRRPVEYAGPHADRLEQKTVDYEDGAQLERDFGGHSHAFFCLGTTRAKSGADGFRKVDHDYALNAARACKAAGVEHYSLCSASGANKDSRFLYMRTKGEVDAEVAAMGFPRASIFRPAMLLCRREESRIMERIAAFVVPALNFAMPDKLAIPTSTVAWAMVSDALKTGEAPAVSIFSNAEMLAAFRDGQQHP
ncbi:Oxidoreductase htatip2 [Coemansia javaensis]|uniref:Oxidoreductase htatip2 n=1 Tax=Coemansia javaensis TaxID=2761396 RepID=A0A9W8HM08_9FUNG|nr:Oxidoreductase htatip2 [Coemansia javaensis]